MEGLALDNFYWNDNLRDNFWNSSFYRAITDNYCQINSDDCKQYFCVAIYHLYSTLSAVDS